MRIQVLFFGILSTLSLQATVYNFHEVVKQEKNEPTLVLATLLKYPILVVKLYKTGCPSCEAIASIYSRAGAHYATEQVLFLEIEHPKFKKIPLSQTVRTLPTIIIFKNGREVARLKGEREISYKSLTTTI